MSAHLTESVGEEPLTSLPGDFRVRKSVTRERVAGSVGSALDFGGRWRGSFARFDRVSSSWRTPQLSLFGGLEEFSETWPQWGMMRGGACWELTMPTPRIRKRIWICADADGQRESQSQGGESGKRGWIGDMGGQVSDSSDYGWESGEAQGLAGSGWWESEPDVGRVAHGVARSGGQT